MITWCERLEKVVETTMKNTSRGAVSAPNASQVNIAKTVEYHLPSHWRLNSIDHAAGATLISMYIIQSPDSPLPFIETALRSPSTTYQSGRSSSSVVLVVRNIWGWAPLFVAPFPASWHLLLYPKSCRQTCARLGAFRRQVHRQVFRSIFSSSSLYL